MGEPFPSLTSRPLSRPASEPLDPLPDTLSGPLSGHSPRQSSLQFLSPQYLSPLPSPHLSRRAALGTGAAALLLMGKIKPALPRAIVGERGRAARIIDGDSFILNLSTADQSQGLKDLSVRLSAVEAPKLSDKTAARQNAPTPNKAAWPFAAQARDALSALIMGRDLRLSYGSTRRDRYGRAVALLHTLRPSGEADMWVQEEMVRLGLARVYSERGDPSDVARLYAAERTARERGRGIWSDDFYAVRGPDPNALAQYVDSVQIVEGIITSTANVRGRIYLNFGADYKTDFTVAIAKKWAKTFTQLDPISLEGARIRVRGWVELMNGPMIWCDHPERIEVLR